MEQVDIALLGLGTVGSGVASLLLERGDWIARRVGVRLRLKHIVVRDVQRRRDIAVPSELLTDDLDKVIADPDVRIAVELWGGVAAARTAVLRLLEAGKDIVTANKSLLAEHGPEVFDQAYRLGRSVAFEAAVGGGVPIVAAVGQSLAANRITSIAGILNGTSNFILTAMAEQGQAYSEALARAQKLGYAEPDPTLDVETPRRSSPYSLNWASGVASLQAISCGEGSTRSTWPTFVTRVNWATRSSC